LVASGLEADQRTLTAHRVYALTATTALTAQNTLGVQDVHITPPAFVEKQIRCILDDMGVEVIKVGMLASADTVTMVHRTLSQYEERLGKKFKIILDPVMVSTSGSQLLPGDAVRVLRTALLPRTFILTPNIPEATLLLRDADIQYRSPSSLDDLKSLARQVASLGPQHVLLKGGHMPLDKKTNQKATASDDSATKIIVDILFSQPDAYTVITSHFLSSPNTHGTGCTLASAISANLAHHLLKNSSDPESTQLSNLIRTSISYVSTGISTSHTLSLKNKGSGPINHFHSILPSLFPPSSFLDYLIHHPSIAPTWHDYIHHPFVTAMANGNLPLHTFKAYLIQDYLYLTHFARTYSLAGYKSTSITQITRNAEIIQHIRREMELHLSYCAEFGLSESDIQSHPRALSNRLLYSCSIHTIHSSIPPCSQHHQSIQRYVPGK
jgi:hydroxymethylpyrimidine kinase/phosphomethylpyrimidine kinase